MPVHWRKWLGFSAFVPAVALGFMEQSILLVALPTMQGDLNATDLELQWCVNAYLLAIAVFVLISGKLGDRIGHRRALWWGVAGFALSSLVCGASRSAALFIAARGFQGLSAALMFPSQTAMIPRLFPPEQRGRANGMIVSIGSLFLIIGPLIGGYLTEHLSWRWIFWINLPIAAAGLYLIRAFLPKTNPIKSRIDFPGFFYFAISAGALTVCFMEAANWGWESPETWSCMAAALLFGLLLFCRERKAPHPFLEITLFKKPLFAAININVAIVQFIMMVSVIRSIYFQDILGYTPAQTGWMIFASACPVFFMSTISGWLSDRFTPKLPIAIGYVALIISFVWFGFAPKPGLTSLLVALVIFGIGIPSILTPSFASAMSSVPLEKAGVAFGMILTLRMLGGTIGLALINLFVSGVQHSQMKKMGVEEASAVTFSAVHFALALLILLAFAATFVLYKRKSAHHLPETPAEGWD